MPLVLTIHMLYKSAFSLILAGTALAATSDCNPLSATTCLNDPALATSAEFDFTSSPSQWTTLTTPTGVDFGDDGLTLTIAKRYDDPAIRSDFYIMFGRVEVSLEAANGTGIVSTFFMQSDDLDEIDIELLGGDTTQFQSNYFSKGNTTTHDRGEYHSTDGSPQTSFKNYTIDWTPERLQWWLDGTLMRTLSSDASEGYPQTPMRLFLNLWAGGDASNDEGTIEWAGGLTTYDELYYMRVKYLKVDDYSTGTSYKYGDQSGDWTSIKAVDGEVYGLSGSSESTSLSSTSKATSKSSSSTKTSIKASTTASVDSTSSKTTTNLTESTSDSTASDSTTSAASDSAVVASVRDSNSTNAAHTTSLIAATTHFTSTSASDISTATDDSANSTTASPTTSSSGASAMRTGWLLISLLIFLF